MKFSAVQKNGFWQFVSTSMICEKQTVHGRQFYNYQFLKFSDTPIFSLEIKTDQILNLPTDNKYL